jgi:hypothetical protein
MGVGQAPLPNYPQKEGSFHENHTISGAEFQNKQEISYAHNYRRRSQRRKP